jgi:hypothetical protein
VEVNAVDGEDVGVSGWVKGNCISVGATGSGWVIEGEGAREDPGILQAAKTIARTSKIMKHFA